MRAALACFCVCMVVVSVALWTVVGGPLWLRVAAQALLAIGFAICGFMWAAMKYEDDQE